MNKNTQCLVFETVVFTGQSLSTVTGPPPKPCTQWSTSVTYCVEFLSRDVGFFARRESSECLLHLRARLDVLCLPTDHECHVFLQWHVTIPEKKQQRGKLTECSRLPSFSSALTHNHLQSISKSANLTGHFSIHHWFSFIQFHYQFVWTSLYW